MMFGLSPLITLAVYGGIAALALGTLYAFDQSRQNIGERRIEAKYQALSGLCDQFPGKTIFGGAKKLTADECAAELRKTLATGTAAVGANVTLQADVADLKRDRDDCSAKVLVLQRRGKIAADMAAARKPEDDKKLAAISSDKEEAIVALGFVDQKLTCEQRIARRDAMWKKKAEERYRDFPPTGAAPASKDVSIRELVK